MWRLIWLLGATLLLSACFQSSSPDNLREKPPVEGVAASIQVDLPAGATQAQVAATVFRDQDIVPLVAGDVFKARSDAEAVILRAIDNLSGDYRGSMAVPNNAVALTVMIEHDAEGSREDRWYPVDELLVDPGPGDLVGYSAEVLLPQEPVISSPLSGEVYTDREDRILLSWMPGDGEQMRLGSVISCGSDTQRVRYATSRVLGEDDGQAEIRLGNLIPDGAVAGPVVDIFTRLAVVLMATALEFATFGLLDGSDWEVQPFTISDCDLDLTLFREKAGNLSAGFAGGFAIGSRSARVAIRYEPVQQP